MAHTLHGRAAGASLGRTPSSATTDETRMRVDCLTPIHAPRPPLARPSGQGDLTVLVRASARRVIALDYDADSFRRALESEGVKSTDDILTVLTSVARLLGEMWLDDSCTFNDVTFGMHRLTLLLIALEPGGAEPGAQPLHGGRIFLAPAPGDQHGFGLAMVGYYLRRAGWDVSADLDSEENHIVDHVAARAYDCVGFSVGHERAVTPLAALIRRIRQHSRRAGLAIMVGGPMIIANPALAAQVGADLWAEDGITLCAKLDGIARSRTV
jgi:methanogenic corrinoid protein MtbC1